MGTKTKNSRILSWTLGIVIFIFVVLGFASSFMIKFSLSPDPTRENIDSVALVLYGRYPDIKPWVDSIKTNNHLKDTFVVMPSGERHHAFYMEAPDPTNNTAIVVHGYRDSAIKFFYLMRMYNRDLGFNVLMPDLHAHGYSEGDMIQMGWKDADDVLHWAEIAEKRFRKEDKESFLVIHGVSMGAATTMNISGKPNLPAYIKGFVEDCGFTTVWDEFGGQLKEQFSLPEFPLMHISSALCDFRYGWNFKEASPLESVKRSTLPMLFIHGDKDDFVPTWMVYPLYEAKPEPKTLWIAPGSAHAKAYQDHPEEYTEQVEKFICTL